MKFTNEQWKKIDDNINNAERLKRQAGSLRNNNLDEIFIEPMSDISSGRLESIGLNIDLNQDVNTIAEHADRLENESQEIMSELENSLVSTRFKNLSRAMKIDDALDQKQNQILDAEIKTRKKIFDAQTTGRTPSAESEFLSNIENYKKQIETKREEIKQHDPESWYGLNLKELKDLKNNLKSGKIVETGYVKKQSDDVMAHVLSGQPVFIHGHLGSGKTELAFHVAKKILENRGDLVEQSVNEKGESIITDNRSALIISGSKHTSLSELYGHMTLDMSTIDSELSVQKREDFLTNVQKRFDTWIENNQSASDSEKTRQFDLIKSAYQTELAGEYAKGTITDFYTGPVFKAMEQGRPVILDEVNAIPHEILISLNHLLTRKPGDKVSIQQDSGKEITVRDGFGFILTGNINDGTNELYIGREDMDPAFLSRLYKMEHQYLPQATEGTIDEASIKNEHGQGNELFEIMMARIMDRHGNIEIPEGELRKIWNLAKAARIIQDIFAGKNTNSSYYFIQSGNSQAQPYRLKEGVLSIRGIDKIISAWQSDGMIKEFDHYVYKEFIGSVANIQDRAFLYQLMNAQFGFFTSNGWNQSPDYGVGGKVTNFNINAPENNAPAKIFMSARDTVDIMFGTENVPERTEFPVLDDEDLVKISPEAVDTINAEAMKNILEAQKDFEHFDEIIEKTVLDLEKTITGVCVV